MSDTTNSNNGTESFDKERVLARVAKMLALANDKAASEGERDNALRMAHATLAKYNLHLAEVESARSSKQNDAQPIEARSHVKEVFWGYPWARRAAAAVSKLFFCEYILAHHASRSDLVHHYFIGREANATTAKLMAFYVIQSILKEANARKAKERNSWSWHTSFCKGAADAVYLRCEQLARDASKPQAQQDGSVPRSHSLAVIYTNEQDANKAYAIAKLGANYKVGRSRERRAGHGYGEGREYGSTINLNKQVT